MENETAEDLKHIGQVYFLCEFSMTAHGVVSAIMCDFHVSSCSTSFQVILAGTLTGVQGDIRCNVLAALSTVK